MSGGTLTSGPLGASRRAEGAPLRSPPPRDDRTLEAGDTPGTRGPAYEATVAASPTTPPTSSERLARLAAELPSVARDAYTVGHEVAKGGIGRVLRAVDRRLDRPVAIKELLIWNEKQEQRFVREALLTARLQHPAIVPIYEAGRWPDGEPFYVMKLVSGRSLAELIGERRSLAERLSLLPHVLTAAQAIAYAHSKRIIHRDLKPANVLVGEFGETVVIDWGLAKDLGENETVAPEGPAVMSGEGLTLQGAIVGTPSYMPPEQAAGRPVDERADVYALGAMLYHLLAAAPPYHEVRWEKLLATIEERGPRRIEELAPQISDELAAIVNKAMARDPADRYRTAKELAEDLESFHSGRIVAAHTYSTGQLLRRYWRRHRPALSAAGAAVALVTLVVIAAFVKTDRDRRFAELKEKEAIEASRSAESARQAAEAAGKQATARADEMTLLQADAALQRDPNRALAWLKTLSRDFVDAAEVRRLAADAQARGIARTYRGHTAHINHVVVSRDNRRFVTASDDKTARVWDVATGRSVVLSGHTDEVWNADFVHGQDRVVSISKDDTLRLWDASTGVEVAKVVLPEASRQLVVRADGAVLGTPRTGTPWIWRQGEASPTVLSAPDDHPTGSFFSWNGERVVVARKDGEVYVRDVDGGGRWPLPRPSTTDGQWCMSANGNVVEHAHGNTIELWDVSRGAGAKVQISGKVKQHDVSPDGELVAVHSNDAILVHETRTGKLRRRLDWTGAPMVILRFGVDGQSLLASSFDRTVRVWDLATGQVEVHGGLEGAASSFADLRGGVLAVSTVGEARLFEPGRAGKILRVHDAPVTGLALSAEGRVASIDREGLLAIDDQDGREIARHTVAPAPHLHLAASPDRTSFAGAPLGWRLDSEQLRVPAANAPPGALILGTFDATVPRQIKMAAGILHLAWTQDSSAVLVALADGSVQRVDREGGIVEIDRFAAPVTALTLSASGAWLAAGSEDGTVRLTELASGVHRELGRHGGTVLALAFSPDGALLATGCRDHTARLWRVEDGTFRSFDEGGHGVKALQFSTDGRTLLLLSEGETMLRRMTVATGEHLAPIPGHTAPLAGFTLSGDGRRILTYALDGTARLVDGATGRGRTLSGHREYACGAFSGDGKTIVTTGGDGGVRAWPDDLPETMPELRAWLEAATPDRIEGL